MPSRYRSRGKPDLSSHDSQWMAQPNETEEASNTLQRNEAIITLRRTHSTTSLPWRLEKLNLPWNGTTLSSRHTTRQNLYRPFYARYHPHRVRNRIMSLSSSRHTYRKSKTNGQTSRWKLGRETNNEHTTSRREQKKWTCWIARQIVLNQSHSFPY